MVITTIKLTIDASFHSRTQRRAVPDEVIARGRTAPKFLMLRS